MTVLKYPRQFLVDWKDGITKRKKKKTTKRGYSSLSIIYLCSLWAQVVYAFNSDIDRAYTLGNEHFIGRIKSLKVVYIFYELPSYLTTNFIFSNDRLRFSSTLEAHNSYFNYGLLIIEGSGSITRCARQPARRAPESMQPTLDVI